MQHLNETIWPDSFFSFLSGWLWQRVAVQKVSCYLACSGHCPCQASCWRGGLRRWRRPRQARVFSARACSGCVPCYSFRSIGWRVIRTRISRRIIYNCYIIIWIFIWIIIVWIFTWIWIWKVWCLTLYIIWIIRRVIRFSVRIWFWCRLNDNIWNDVCHIVLQYGRQCPSWQKKNNHKLLDQNESMGHLLEEDSYLGLIVFSENFFYL